MKRRVRKFHVGQAVLWRHNKTDPHAICAARVHRIVDCPDSMIEVTPVEHTYNGPFAFTTRFVPQRPYLVPVRQVITGPRAIARHVELKMQGRLVDNENHR